MKKQRILSCTTTIILLSIFLTGCSNEQYKGAFMGPIFSWIQSNKSVKKNVNTSANIKKNQRSIVTAYYEDLSKVDKKRVKFIFKLKEDETKDNTADPVYVVSMTIKNKSNKVIKFDKSKFIYMIGDEKNISKKTGVITIKPGKQIFVDQLFNNVGEQSTLGGGAIIYLNKHNIIAYNSFKNYIATSSNSSNKKLQRDFKELDETDNSGSTDSSVDSNADQDESTVDTTSSANSSSSSSMDSSSSSSYPHQTEAEAIEELQSRADMAELDIDVSSMTAKDIGTGWSFTDSSGSTWYMNDDESCSGPGL